MKAFIVDDERLARNELKRLLQVFSDIIVVGEAKNVDEALGKIEELRPDLLFLDIQMPGKNGFELLEQLNYFPTVIFTTAYDEYALKAFEVSALDYLLKPIDPKRFTTAVIKAIEHRQKTNLSSEKHLLGDGSQVFVKEGEKCWFVNVNQIKLIESEGNYIRLHFDDNRPLILRSMTYLEERLDPQLFFRVGRKHIINLKWIDKVEQDIDGTLIVHLAGNIDVKMSRRQSQKFREITGI